MAAGYREKRRRKDSNMRVITGSARGRKLKELEGKETRPTSDRVKESVFNIIQFELEGGRVLDLFAGTGQLGIEALSRGAAAATFVEQRRDAANLIRENLKRTGLAGSARVVNGDAISFLKTTKEKFDFIFLDPPFPAQLWDTVIDIIYRFDILMNHGIIICESPHDQPLPPVAPPYFLHRSYRYGRIKITTYQKKEDGQE